MRFFGLVVLLGLTASAGHATLACGGTSAPPPAYPPYTTHEAMLFDDAVDPRVVGVGFDTPNAAPRGDAALFERAQIGDLVVRGRIDSVTLKGSGPSAPIELGIRVIESLGRPNPQGEPIHVALRVERSSPSYGMARGLEHRLSGRTMIAFVRTYSNEAGEPALHFHLVPDEPAVAAAVREALSLDRVAPTDGGAPSGKR